MKKSGVQQELSSLSLGLSSEENAEVDQLEVSPKINVQLPTPEQRPRPSLSPEQHVPRSPATDVATVQKISLSKSADSLHDSPPRVFVGSGDGGSLFSPVRPSSPLLSVLREAVDSLSSIEDFEKLELIGSGFFAEVYKVSQWWVSKQRPTKTVCND